MTAFEKILGMYWGCHRDGTSNHQQIRVEVLLFSIILYHNILYTLFAVILYYFSIMLIIFLAVSRLLFPIIFKKITDYYIWNL
jgi:hypothetical protein